MLLWIAAGITAAFCAGVVAGMGSRWLWDHPEARLIGPVPAPPSTVRLVPDLPGNGPYDWDQEGAA